MKYIRKYAFYNLYIFLMINIISYDERNKQIIIITAMKYNEKRN